MQRFGPALARLALVSILVCSPACRSGAPSGSVTFNSVDGFTLSGTLKGSGTKGVVLSHMFPADQRSWFDFRDELVDRGYLVVTFDFRGFGRSEGDKQINLLDRDVRGAVQFIRERGATSVVLVGASMGGAASIVAAGSTDRDRIHGVATLSAPQSFRGLDANNALIRVNARKLFIASDDDPEGADEAVGALLKASADPEAESLIVAGDAHGTEMLKDEAVQSRLIRFLSEVQP